MKSRIFLFMLLAFASCSTMQGLNYKVFNGATSSHSKTGSVFEDTVKGSGTNGEQFSYISKKATGDTDIILKIVNADSANTLSEAGLMVRSGLHTNAAMFAVYTNGTRRLEIKARWSDGGSMVTTFFKSMQKHSLWLKVERRGQQNFIYYKYKKNWSWVYLDNVAFMPSGEYRAGIFSASGVGVTDGIFKYKKFSVKPVAARMSDDPAGSFLLHPNPASSIVNLGVEAKSIRVYSMTGKLVIERQNQRSVNLEGLPSGAYYIRADGNYGRLSKL